MYFLLVQAFLQYPKDEFVMNRYYSYALFNICDVLLKDLVKSFINIMKKKFESIFSNAIINEHGILLRHLL